MKRLSRQDRNGTRNSEELRRRYQFENIDYTKEEIEKLKLQIITDDHLSTTSKNPVQNRVVTNALNNKAGKSEVNAKVDKEDGKGLSSNDFTDYYKEFLDGFDGDIEAFLLEHKAEIEALITSDVLSAKADKSYVDTELDKKADIVDVPTKTSDLVNDSGFINQHQDISGKADKSYVDSALEGKQDTLTDYTDIPNVETVNVTVTYEDETTETFQLLKHTGA